MQWFRRMGDWLAMASVLVGTVGCVRVQEPIGHADAGASDGGSGNGPGSTAGRQSAPNAGTGDHGSGSGGAQAGRGGRGERAGTGGVHALPQAGHGGVAGTYDFAGASGQFSPWSGGVGGTFPPPYVGGAGGELWWGSAGATACGCDDGDPCTEDLCGSFGNCRHVSRVTGPADNDADGFMEGCDCNDEVLEARPNQTVFFGEGRTREWGIDFDFDCDGTITHMLTGVARDCELHPSGTTCLGGGWVGPIADCGVEAPYQVCDLMGEACRPVIAGIVQRCR